MKQTQPKSMMKRLLTVTAALGLVACGTGAANANDLFNPDLDVIAVSDQVNASPVGWHTTAEKTISGPFNDGADSEPWCNVQQAGGYGVFFKPFQGSTNANATLDDLLTVNFYQDNPSSPNTKYILSGYAAGEANFCAFLPAPPGQSVPPQALFVVEFLDVNGVILQSNAFNLVTGGLPNGGPGSMALFTTPQYTAPALTTTVRAGAFLINAYGTGGAQSFFVDAFNLASTPAPGSPIVTTQPTAVTVSSGATAHFNVVTAPAATTYVWLFNGTALSDSLGHIAGSGTASLTITGASSADVGHYQAVVSNGSGLNRSAKVPLALDSLHLFPVITLTGTIGDTYQVNRASAITGPWTPYTTVKLTSSPQYITDYTLPVSAAEFYQEVFQY